MFPFFKSITFWKFPSYPIICKVHLFVFLCALYIFYLCFDRFILFQARFCLFVYFIDLFFGKKWKTMKRPHWLYAQNFAFWSTLTNETIHHEFWIEFLSFLFNFFNDFCDRLIDCLANFLSFVDLHLVSRRTEIVRNFLRHSN